MPAEYMLADLAGIAAAALIFPFFLLLPAYPLAWILNPGRLRCRPIWHQALLTLPVAVALLPIIVFLTARLASFAVSWAVIGALSLATPLILISTPRARHGSRLWILALGIFAFWTAAAALSLADLPFRGGLFPSVAVIDLGYRSALVSHLASVESLPADSFLFSDGRPANFRYHYLWFLFSALPLRVFGDWLQPRWILAGQVPWLCLSLWSVALLFLRTLPSRTGAGRRAAWAAFLFVVSGLDILMIPVASRLIGPEIWSPGWPGEFPSVDLWNLSMIVNWTGIFLWVPHCAVALAACLVAFLLLFQSRANEWLRIAAAALAFASAIGSSAVVAFVFAVFLSAWFAGRLWARRWREAGSLSVFAALAGLAALPFLLDIFQAGGHSFVRLQVRPFTFVWAVLNQTFPSAPAGVGALLDLVLMPVQYFLELGVFAVPMLLFFIPRLRARMTALPGGPVAVLLVSALLAISLLATNNAPSNDIGWRGAMFVQFAALVWTAALLDRPGRLRALVLALLVVGIATTLWELWTLRTFFPRVQAKASAGALPERINFYARMIDPRTVGALTLERRRAFAWLNSALPPSARVQWRPLPGYDPFNAMYTRRPVVLGSKFPTDLGVTRDRADPLYAVVAPIFEHGAAASPWPRCEKYSIAALLASSSDPVWADPQSWVWTRVPAWTGQHLRIFLCHNR
jgi:hypothetical protein